jgi:hypothetical protein
MFENKDMIDLETITKQINENRDKIITLLNRYLDAITEKALNVNEYTDLIKRFVRCALRMCYIKNVESLDIEHMQHYHPYAIIYIDSRELTWKKIYATDEVVVHYNNIPLARIFIRYEGEVLRNGTTNYIKIEKINNVYVEIEEEEDETAEIATE